jgi:hypothetical protein
MSYLSLEKEAVFLFRPLEQYVDLGRLRAETWSLLADVPFDERNQICLQTGGIDDWYEGTGAMPGGEDLSKFDEMHPKLKGTWWESFIKNLPYKVSRTRIARLPPRKCYSVHQDFHRTLHIAIHTNPKAYFLFVKEQRLIHISADSDIWYVDTKRLHTAFNGGDESRLHLMMRVDD